MRFKVKVRNYRSIIHDHPIEFQINRGITFILGVNNAGKSNLLRFFVELRELFSRTYGNGFSQGINLKYPFDQLANRKSFEKPIFIDLIFEDQRYELKIQPTRDTHSNSVILSVIYENPNGANYWPEISEIFGRMLYIGPFRSPISNNPNQNQSDISSGSQFINEWKSWADGDNVTRSRKISKLIYELKDLFDFKEFNIKPHLNGANLIVNIDGEQFTLTEMGSGFSHFILVLANALIKEPSLILIDEPETNLHPRLQETFTRVLASKSTFGVIATSHSIGLARSIADHIYSLTRDDKGISKLETYGTHFAPTISQSVLEMGYSQYTELGGNNILLVEGRSEIKVFREILRKYAIDKHFIIIPLGGSQFILSDKEKIIDELNELKRLNSKSVSVIFDSERTSAKDNLKGKFKSFSEVCDTLGFNVHATQRHSTENYFTQSAIKKVMGEEFRELEHYEKLSQSNWDKNKNWLIAKEMEKSEFDNTDLGEFILTKLVEFTKG